MPRLDPGGLSGAFKRTRRARSLDFLVPDKTEEASPETTAKTTQPVKAAPAKPEAKAAPKKATARKKATAKKKAPAKPKAKKAPAKPKAKKAPAKPRAKKKAPAKPKAKRAPEPKAEVTQAPTEPKRTTPRPLGRPLVRKAPGTPAWPAERGVRAWATRRAERFVARLLRRVA